jgi:hypothetical protein
LAFGRKRFWRNYHYKQDLGNIRPRARFRYSARFALEGYHGARRAIGLEINFDDPDSSVTSLLVRGLRDSKQGHSIKQPLYNFTTQHRMNETIRVTPKEIIIVDGVLIFVEKGIAGTDGHKDICRYGRWGEIDTQNLSRHY